MNSQDRPLFNIRLPSLSALLIFWSVAILNGHRAYSASLCSKLFSSDQVFASRETLVFGLQANFALITKKSDYQLESENRDVKKFFVPGELKIDGAKIAVQVRGNGSTSADHEEASFRKLKVRLDLNSLTENPFLGLKDFYINTHMQNSPKTKWSPLGRLVDGNSPFREGLVYDLAGAFGIETGDIAVHGSLMKIQLQIKYLKSRLF